MSDDVSFQSSTLATPAAGTVIATDDVSGVQYQEVKLDAGGDGASVPIVAGRNADAASLPVAVSSEDFAALGALTETAPASDTASSGLNGRLQRIAQRLTTLIALLPTSLGAGGGLKVDGSGTALPISAASLPLPSGAAQDSTFTGRIGEVQASPTANTVLDRLKTIATLLSGTLTVGSHNVTNAGTFAVQDSAAETSLSTLAGIVSSSKAAVKSAAGDIVDLATLLTRHPSALGATTKSGSLPVVLPTDQILTPKWTDGTTITAITTLSRGSMARATYTCTSKYGAYIYVYLARTGTTAITTLALQVRIRRVVNGVTNLVPEAAFSADTAAAVSAAMAGSGNNAGVTTVTLNASATFASGTNGEIWAAILDSTSSPTAGGSEWVRMSKATDANNTSKLLDAPTVNAHNSTSHTMLDKANVFRAYVEGGCTYEIIVDYGAAGAGDTYVYQILAQSLDSQGWA